MSPIIANTLALREKGKLGSAVMTYAMLSVGGILIGFNANSWVLIGVVLIVWAWTANVQTQSVDAAIEYTDMSSAVADEQGFVNREDLHAELVRIREELDASLKSIEHRLS